MSNDKFSFINLTRTRNRIIKNEEKKIMEKKPLVINLKETEKKRKKKNYRVKPVPDVIDEKMLYEKAMKVLYLPTRMFIFVSYLSAGRRDEVRGILKRDITYNIVNGKPFAKIHMRNLKNKKRPLKDVPVALDNDIKKSMFKQIIRYTHYLESNSLLFSSTSKEGWTMRVKRAVIFDNHRFIDYNTKNYIYKKFEMFPHFIRHVRLTQIVRDYPNISPIALQYIAGWTSLDMAQVYIHSNWQDITKYMLNKFKKGDEI